MSLKYDCYLLSAEHMCYSNGNWVEHHWTCSDVQWPIDFADSTTIHTHTHKKWPNKTNQQTENCTKTSINGPSILPYGQIVTIFSSAECVNTKTVVVASRMATRCSCAAYCMWSPRSAKLLIDYTRTKRARKPPSHQSEATQPNSTPTATLTHSGAEQCLRSNKIECLRPKVRYASFVSLRVFSETGNKIQYLHRSLRQGQSNSVTFSAVKLVARSVFIRIETDGNIVIFGRWQRIARGMSRHFSANQVNSRLFRILLQ